VTQWRPIASRARRLLGQLAARSAAQAAVSPAGEVLPTSTAWPAALLADLSGARAHVTAATPTVTAVPPAVPQPRS